MHLLPIGIAVLLAGACAGAPVERISTGYQFTEGPVWTRDGRLLFSDIPANTIYTLSGDKKAFRKPSGNSNGLTLDNSGRLIACEHSNRRITRTETDGSITVLADKYAGKRLNSPNDAVLRSDGSIFFTDPPYGVDAQSRELDFCGVYMIGPKGNLKLLAKDFEKPNGICFSPDEKTLYVADSSDRRHVRAFDLSKSGTISNGQIFATITDASGIPDGLKTDVLGNLYAAGPGGIWVFDATGKHIETIAVPETPSNLAWGGNDAKTLYITARSSIYKTTRHIGGKLPSRASASGE